MKSSAKKLFSLLLVTVMVFGVLPAIGLIATAETATESESNDDYASADLIMVNSSVIGDMYVNYDKDYYKIIPDSNGKLELTFKHNYVDDGMGWYVSVYYYDNNQYNELSYTEITLNGNETVKLPSVGVVGNGTYYVLVGSIWEWDNPVGYDYIIDNSFTATECYEREVNNDYSSANDIKLNNSFSGTINIGHDKDYYKIVPDSNGKLELTFKHNYVDNGHAWTVSVYYYNGDTYTELSYAEINLNGSETKKLPSIGAVGGGLYYIVVGSLWEWGEPVGVEYTIENGFISSDNYERELNNSYLTANLINVNSSYSGTINRLDDEDYYKIIPEANGKIELTFKHNYSNDDCGWYIKTIYYDNNNYNELSYFEIYMNHNETIKLPNVGAVKEGVYYIIVGSIWDSVGHDYIIETKFSPTEYYEKELNNSYTSATYITSKSLYSGNVSSDNDSDYFKFVAQSNANIPVSFNHTYKDSWEEWNITFFKYASGAYTELENVCVSVNDSLESKEVYTLNATKGTTYYIRITGYAGLATSEYSFILGNEPVVIPEYSLTYNANGGSGAPAAQTGSTSYTIPSTVPTRSGYTFLGWSENSKATSATYSSGQTINLTKNTVLYAVWKKNETPVTPPETWYTCPYCGGKFNDYTKYDAHIKAETTPPPAIIDIMLPSTTTISYGDSIILHADVKNLPEGGYIDWYVSNGNFTTSISSDDSKLTITPYSSGETVITAVVYDADGNELDSDTQTMTSKAGFFQKIIAFFKKLFGMTKVIPQYIEKI